MNPGDFEARGLSYRLRIYVGAAADHDGSGAPPQRVAARRRQRRIEARRDTMPAALKPWSRLTTMVVRPCSGLPIET